MASRKKAPQTSKAAPKSGRPAVKQATIDLKAKEVKQDAKTSVPEKTAATKPASKKTEPVKDTITAAKVDAKTDTKPAAATTEKKVETKATSKPEKQSPPPQAKVKSSFGSMMLSAILGAGVSIIGLGLLGHSQTARQIPFVEKFYSGFSNSGVSNTQEAAGLDAKIKELTQANASINEKIAELEKSNTASSDNTEANAQITELTSKVEEIDKLINETDTGEEDGNSSAMANGIKLAAISQKQTELEEQIYKLGAKAAPDLSAIENTLTDLMAKTNALEQSAQTNASSITELSSGAEAIASQVAAVKVNEQVASSVAINALKTALQNNDSILIALSSVEALGGETEHTKRLKEIADKGIPNLKALTNELDDIVQTVQNPVEVADDASFTDKLWASAGSLVTVRSTTPREGNDPLAIFSRIKANLENDNLDGVETEWMTLPADLREKHTGWIEKVALRKEAFALHQQLSDGLAVNAG